MSSNYQIWLTYDGEKEKLQFPVNPDNIKIGDGSNNSSIDINGLGEITIPQDRKAYTYEFSSFFPATYFSGCKYRKIPIPKDAVEKIRKWKNGEKPAHLLITGTSINTYCTIENFPVEERGGDVGTQHFTIKFKEYREVSVRKINVSKSKAEITSFSTRTDNIVTGNTYKVVAGDCLYNIAKRLYGSGSQYTKIYNANKKLIGGNPNKIYPGQVLTIP